MGEVRFAHPPDRAKPSDDGRLDDILGRGGPEGARGVGLEAGFAKPLRFLAADEFQFRQLSHARVLGAFFHVWACRPFSARSYNSFPMTSARFPGPLPPTPFACIPERHLHLHAHLPWRAVPGSAGERRDPRQPLESTIRRAHAGGGGGSPPPPGPARGGRRPAGQTAGGPPHRPGPAPAVWALSARARRAGVSYREVSRPERGEAKRSATGRPCSVLAAIHSPALRLRAWVVYMKKAPRSRNRAGRARSPRVTSP